MFGVTRCTRRVVVPSLLPTARSRRWSCSINRRPCAPRLQGNCSPHLLISRSQQLPHTLANLPPIGRQIVTNPMEQPHSGLMALVEIDHDHNANLVYYDRAVESVAAIVENSYPSRPGWDIIGPITPQCAPSGRVWR